jgi:hypothetical protein
MRASEAPAPVAAARPGALRALAGCAALMALLILIQAALAGRFLAYSGEARAADLQRLHGYLGNAVFLLALVQVGLVVWAGIVGRARGTLLGTTVLVLVLVTAQIGLGYAGRENAFPASLHLPNGVLLFGLSMATISLALRARRGRA